ncbi:hypothetical protein M0R45_011411 [Rubus argutus]|uniref:Uncharacterized protein n=1 Tax=Rubus argutus TaxID=59490 RepID=A0AAW1YB12_RUBAR
MLLGSESIRKIKLAWKKNKKRPLGIVSNYPNLPFEHKNDQLRNQNDAADEPNGNQHHTDSNREQHRAGSAFKASPQTLKKTR